MKPPSEKGTKKDLVLYRLETAETNLRSAKILLDAGDFKGGNNRAYYSIFHSISAVHAMDGNSYKRHKDAIANFNKEYIKTEIFPRTLGRKISIIHLNPATVSLRREPIPYICGLRTRIECERVSEHSIRK